MSRLIDQPRIARVRTNTLAAPLPPSAHQVTNARSRRSIPRFRASHQARAGRTGYQQAAEAGLEHGQFNLARCYGNGWGTSKELKEAVKWYTRAAEQGHADAQSNLGRCYENGCADSLEPSPML
eukprot:1564369-Pyramimonas_sp.AAC.1